MPLNQGQFPQGGQVPYGNMAQPQQQIPYGNMGQPQQQIPKGIPGSYPPPGNMNMPQGNRPMNAAPQGPKNTGKSAKKAAKKAQNKKKWVTLGIFAGLGLVFGILLFSLVNRYARQLTVVELPGAPIIASTSNSVTTNADGGEQATVIKANDSLDLSQQTTQKGQAWDGKNRITCLAMGLDYRDWVQNDGTPRSDTMMLLTYDPQSGYAGMLSIPRDLWVAIPDHGYGRINTAYSMGEGEHLPGVNGKPGGGAGLAMRTVELFLGIDIQYYAVIDFYGFIEFIDTIDKLAINVRDDIWVDPLGEGNTVYLRAGVQDLDGATALAYARYRYTEGGDFERAQRQQDVIMALFKQMQWQLPELLTTKSQQLFDCIQRAVKTNLTLSDMMKLAWTVVDMDAWYVKRAVIAPPDQVLYEKSADGQQILVPVPDRIREARDTIFKVEFGAGQTVSAENYSEEQRLKDEAAKITLINGSTIPGAAEKTVEILNQLGMQVVSVASGATGYYNSLEIKTGKPYSAKYLQNIMAIPTSAISLNYDPTSGADLVLTITDDWANRLQM